MELVRNMVQAARILVLAAFIVSLSACSAPSTNGAPIGEPSSCADFNALEPDAQSSLAAQRLGAVDQPLAIYQDDGALVETALDRLIRVCAGNDSAAIADALATERTMVGCYELVGLDEAVLNDWATAYRLEHASTVPSDIADAQWPGILLVACIDSIQNGPQDADLDYAVRTLNELRIIDEAAYIALVGGEPRPDRPVNLVFSITTDQGYTGDVAITVGPVSVSSSIINAPVGKTDLDGAVEVSATAANTTSGRNAYLPQTSLLIVAAYPIDSPYCSVSGTRVDHPGGQKYCLTQVAQTVIRTPNGPISDETMLEPGQQTALQVNPNHLTLRVSEDQEADFAASLRSPAGYAVLEKALYEYYGSTRLVYKNGMPTLCDVVLQPGTPNSWRYSVVTSSVGDLCG